jgi:hypothetical protein
MKKMMKVFMCTLVIATMILSACSVSVLSNTIDFKNNVNINKTKFFTMNNLRTYLTERLNEYRNKYLNLNKPERTHDYFYNSPLGWSPTELVSTESTASSTGSSVATDAAGNVYVVWQDDTNYTGCGDNFHVFYKMKSKEGTWTKTEVVSSGSPNDSELPSLAVEPDGTVHVIWDEYTNTTNEVYYRMKPAGGNWTTTECISLDSCEYSAIPSICVDLDGNIHVAMNGFNDAGDIYIYYKMKPSGGNWTAEELVTGDSLGFPYLPKIDVDSDGTLHVVWEEIDVSGYFINIFYKMKPSGGDWTNAKQVSNSNIIGVFPSLTIDTEDNLHVTWSDLSPYDWMDINYRMKSKNGDWSNIETISPFSFAMISSLSASPEGTVSVAFDDLDFYGSMYYDIYYRAKPLGGDWSDPEIVTDDFDPDGMYPSLAMDTSGCAHVTWEGYDYSNIYYKNNSYENFPPITPPAPAGPIEGFIGTLYSFSSVTTDPNGDKIYYFFDWGDGTNSGWVGPYTSGTMAIATHAWPTAGVYLVKVKAKDENGAETVWSPTHSISIIAMPSLTIEDFKGGRGISAVLSNVGNGTATNVTWTIDITGKHIFYGAHSTGHLASLAPGNSTKIYNTALLLGVGKIYINATATCAEGATYSEEGTGILILIFVIGVKEPLP